MNKDEYGGITNGYKTVTEIAEKLKQEGKIQFDQLIYYPRQNFVHFGFKLDKAQERGMSWINN